MDENGGEDDNNNDGGINDGEDDKLNWMMCAQIQSEEENAEKDGDNGTVKQSPSTNKNIPCRYHNLDRIDLLTLGYVSVLCR